MTTRIYYLPRTAAARATIHRICSLVPCSIAKVKAVGDSLAFVLTYQKNSDKVIQRVLRQGGFLE